MNIFIIGDFMNKYKLFMMIFLLIFLSFFNLVFAESKKLSLLSKVIYLDPGHGGADSGAFYKNYKESDINLAISQKLMHALKAEGAVVYLTRYGDYDLSVGNAWNRKRSDLSRRANIINKSKCDLYLSIHLNADSSGTLSGAEVYYDTINIENEKIASIFQEEFKKYLNSKREYKENSTKYLQRRVNRPGVLLEVGFLSNDNERSLLTNDVYQNKLVNVIKGGIIKYFNN